ncbi:RagB/SusD family nutrient uptake outer membrane protein [Reichenbachiella sp. MALMAid0571]|uniref:RagB/SusD family nutrient uptake outer membrane protein n=1 Tax=Reichenbachiella sp. MALMAid0571 TaxID=3143939 RepID=UPI0032DF7460
MKNIRYIFSIIVLCFVAVSCDHNELLTENPKDFFSPSNAFKTEQNFVSALADIYLDNRNNFYSSSDDVSNYSLLGADLDLTYTRQDAVGVFTNEYFDWNTFNADAPFVSKWYGTFYQLIFKANTIIDRIDDITWDSEEDRDAIVAEARFLRAHYYRLLANMWGGAPLILEETKAPRFDYTRETRENVYLQCKADLEYATQHMYTVDQVPGGRAPKAAAYHVLAEVNIQLGDYQDAIDAASAVIDGGNYALMTSRFGLFSDFQWRGYDYIGPDEPWGDVYWDMFRKGNFNRSAGNTETIWNCQFEFDVVGGASTDRTEGNFGIERHLGGPIYWNGGQISDLNGVRNVYKDTLMGRPTGVNGATDYLRNQIWNFNGDFNNDIRNSKYNIQRTYYWNNPESAFFGTPWSEATCNPAQVERFNGGRINQPSFKKNVELKHEAYKVQDGEDNSDGRIFKDWYIMRLAETYLLRAEAYHLNGDNGSAAADINAVRNRAQATSVTAGDVDLDLILDERARELHFEEYRMNTLLRMGKLAEYLRKYHSATLENGYTIPDHYNLMPIPSSEIEANKDAVLEQNTGY